MQNNKGFIMIEFLIAILITSILSLLSISYMNVNFDNQVFASKYSYMQSESIANKTYSNISEYDIYFNKEGKVNRGKTINIDNRKYVIRLGYGNLRYE